MRPNTDGRAPHVTAGLRVWARIGRVVLPVGLALGLALPLAGSGVAGAASAPQVPLAGYRLLGGDGGVFAFAAPFVGSAASDPTTCAAATAARTMPEGTCWSMATTPDDRGYWILNAYSGAVTPYGDAVSYGDRTASNVGGADTWPTSVALVATPDGRGYWMLDVGLSGLGTVVPYGDAVSYGDQSTLAASGGIAGVPVGLAATPDGRGYWIVDSDGGVFAFGDAAFDGSMGGHTLAADVVGMARTPDGQGYWLAATDGGVFAFGDATFGGSMAGTRLAAPVTGIAAEEFGGGYWLAASDGGVFALGGAPFLGSMAGRALARPVLAISTPSASPV